VGVLANPLRQPAFYLFAEEPATSNKMRRDMNAQSPGRRAEAG
jgi:hypothetical protein